MKYARQNNNNNTIIYVPGNSALSLTKHKEEEWKAYIKLAYLNLFSYANVRKPQDIGKNTMGKLKSCKYPVVGINGPKLLLIKLAAVQHFLQYYTCAV